MRRPGGYGICIDPGPPRGTPSVHETDSFTCKHCQFVVFVPPFSAPSAAGGWCGCCAAPICGPCADRGVCEPWERQMEKMEARERFLRSAGL